MLARKRQGSRQRVEDCSGAKRFGVVLRLGEAAVQGDFAEDQLLGREKIVAALRDFATVRLLGEAQKRERESGGAMRDFMEA